MLDKIDQVKVDTEAQQQILIIFIPGLATKRQLLKKKKNVDFGCVGVGVRMCSAGISSSYD